MLDRLMTKLVSTLMSMIGMGFFVINAEKILRLLRPLFAMLVITCMVLMFLLTS
jgi:hypothetical protein